MGVFVLFVVYMVCLYVLFIHGCEEWLAGQGSEGNQTVLGGGGAHVGLGSGL